MAQYNYDENGAIFSYFMLTILTLILIPTTISMILGLFKKEVQPVINCACKACTAKASLLKTTIERPITLNKNLQKKSGDKTSSPWKWWILLFSWILFGGVVYAAFTLQHKEDVLWDPYLILDIETGADAATIKKSFRKLSLTYHPDKVKEEEKAAAELKFIDISKAYQVLTDEEARKNWEEFGHPDGKQG